MSGEVWESCLPAGSPHPIFLREGTRWGLQSCLLPQSQHLHQAPLNPLLNAYMRFIKTDVGCCLKANTSRHVIPFPGNPGNPRLKEAASFASFGAGGGGQPRPGKIPAGRWPSCCSAAAQTPKERGVGGGQRVDPQPGLPQPHPTPTHSSGLDWRTQDGSRSNAPGGTCPHLSPPRRQKHLLLQEALVNAPLPQAPAQFHCPVAPLDSFLGPPRFPPTPLPWV